MIKIEELLEEIKRRTNKNSSLYYRKFKEEESNILREYYRSQLNIPLQDSFIFTPNNLLLANGYNRIVIGDYGAYIECLSTQIVIENIRQRWPGKPNRSVKYIWMEPIDGSEVKIYYQKRKVDYADYIPKRYYFNPSEILIRSKNDKED